MIRKLFLAITTLATFTGAAHADSAVYTSAAFSNMTSPAVDWCSECGGGQQIVDAFSLSSATVLGGATTAIESDYGSNWNITVSLYDSSFHVMDSTTFAWGSYSVNYLGNSVDEVKFTLPDWSVGAGNYFIGFTDYNLGAPGYHVGDTELQYNLQYQDSPGTSAALQLTSSVPEGSSLAFMLAGLGAVAAGLRRRRA